MDMICNVSIVFECRSLRNFKLFIYYLCLKMDEVLEDLAKPSWEAVM